MSSPTTTTRYRLIDELAAVQGALRLPQATVGKAHETNTSLHHNKKQDDDDDDSFPAAFYRIPIGAFPAGGDVGKISILAQIAERIRHSSSQQQQQQDPDTASLRRLFSGETEFGHALKAHFHQPQLANRCTNFPSFGLPPIAVTVAQSLYQSHIVDADSDSFMRIELHDRMRDVRRALADYMCVEDHDDLFVLDNVAETMNSAISSLLFNPLRLKAQMMQRAARHEKKAGARTLDSSPTSAKPRFSIYMLSTTYPMVKECCDFHYNRLMSLNSFSAATTNLPFDVDIVYIPLTRAMIASLSDIPAAPSCVGPVPAARLAPGTKNLFVDTVVNAVLERADTESGGAALIIDHIAFSPGGMIYPVVEISARIKSAAPETTIIIDGAHAIGALPLQFADELQKEPALSLDVYMSNAHKHLGNPKSSAVMFVKRELHVFFNPSTISNMHVGEQSAAESDGLRGAKHINAEDVGKSPTGKLHKAMVWRGTIDFTPFLVLADVLWFRRAVSSKDGDSDTRWMLHNRELALRGGLKMAKVWGTSVLLFEDLAEDGSFEEMKKMKAAHCFSSMVNVRVPCSVEELGPAVTHSMLACSNFLASVVLEGTAYVRVGSQVYMEESDFEWAAEQFLKSLVIVRGVAAERNE